MPRINPGTCQHPTKRLQSQRLPPVTKRVDGKDVVTYPRKLGFYHCARCHSDVSPFGERSDTLRISARVTLRAGDRVTINNGGAALGRGRFWYADSAGTAHVLTTSGNWRMVDPKRLKRSKT